MIRTRFIVTVEVEGNSDAECWRLFNEKLGNGEGAVDTQVLSRTPAPITCPRQSVILPTTAHDTILACRNGDTLPCSGVVVRNNIHQG